MPGAVDVAGHSFGGGVALQLARDRPRQVRGAHPAQPGRRRERPRRRRPCGWAGRPAPPPSCCPGALARSAPAVLRAFLPNLSRPLTLALTARLALSAALGPTAEALVAGGLPVAVVWSDRDRLLAPGALARVAGLPAQRVRGSHGWLLDAPEEFAQVLRDALAATAAPAPGRASGRITP